MLHTAANDIDSPQFPLVFHRIFNIKGLHTIGFHTHVREPSISDCFPDIFSVTNEITVGLTFSGPPGTPVLLFLLSAVSV